MDEKTAGRREALERTSMDFSGASGLAASGAAGNDVRIDPTFGADATVAAVGSVRKGVLQRFLRQQSVRWYTVLAISEFLLLNLAAFLSVQLRFLNEPEGLQLALQALPVRGPLFASFIVLSLSAVGLYQRHSREGFFGTLTRLVVAFLAGAVALMVLYYVLPDVYSGRGVLGFSLGLGFVFTALFRAGFFRLISEQSMRRRVLVLGAGRRAGTIHRRMRRRIDHSAIKLLGFVPMTGEEPCVPQQRLLHLDGPLLDYARKHHVDEIVVGPEDRRQQLPMGELLACRMAGIDVTELAAFFERETGKVKLDLITPACLVFSTGFKSTEARHFSKRSTDMVAAGLILALCWPLMLLTALAIWIESGGRGPILYRQERVGQGGAVFQLIKFRSMRTDAEQDGVARWAKQNDDRVTRVGRVIRATRLDELPQLWNVFSGAMSLVGPRPERPQFVQQLSQRIPYYGLRHCVKPGLAGWAQLRYPYGASEEDAMEKLKFDLYYAKHHDLKFDLMVLIQTVEIVMFRRGAR